ncbi:hypothetical protein M2347_003212 [Chryseobacterium sp. H1D6B]|uniref:heme oxygenase n=1 Tax=Chryseobacterium sp. H1D6B TaxID=2940588 RepID=UPI0015C6CFDB|nr:heme oxygenase [Chryseobacterium sp. H1D6B]MDH6253485.1 hypothetical protein [Chryseobacterium sp. H1D6B]
MKTIHLYKFKDSISRKMPLFSEQSNLNSLNDLMQSDLMDVEIVTEYIIDISDDIPAEKLTHSALLELCTAAKETIEHYFVTTVDNYDVI